MKKLVLEDTAPFQGLPELVAYDEGLFAKEGLEVAWADRKEDHAKAIEFAITSPKAANPFSSHGKMLEQGKADMYNGCEWGNYCRVQDTAKGSRQLGRRAIISYTAIVVRPDSPAYTPQQLANRTIGVPFYFGTYYAALHMLEGFLARDEIKMVHTPNTSQHRYAALMRGEVEATTLAEPYHDARREEGLPGTVLDFLPRHRGRLQPSRRRDLCSVQPRSARGGAAHQCQQVRLSALFHRLLQKTTPKSLSSRSSDLRKAGWWWSTLRQSRSTRCSVPLHGSRAGACWKTRNRHRS